MLIPPTRCLELKITIGADTWEDAVRSVQQVLFDLERRDGTTFGPIISGSPSAGYTVDIAHNPAQTHDAYFEALNAYLEDREEADKDFLLLC